MNHFEQARTFIYRCARPVDLARWQYHFEGGSQEAVLRALSAYQNSDGGFGHALEADSFNPNSCPIQTWAATEILREIDFTDPRHPMIEGILRYLASGADFDAQQRQWLNTVPSNNDHPCAIWWKYGDEGSAFRYNPTACLAGFALRFADPASSLYGQCLDIAREAFDWLMTQPLVGDHHIAACFIRLYEYCAAAGVAPFDPELLRQRLSEMVRVCLDGVADKWGKEYAPMPSDLIASKASPFYADNAGVIAAQCDYIKRSQLPDGSFPVVWQWYAEHREYEVAVLWWKGDITVKNMRHLLAFDQSSQP